VEAVVELSGRNAERLTEKIAQVNDQKGLVRRLPTEAQVAGWIRGQGASASSYVLRR
jgi:Domain of unknown function (DUF4332)